MPPAVNIERVRRPPTIRRVALLALTAVLVATGCSDGYRDITEAHAARIGTTSDINPRDPATLRDGGNLRLSLTMFPDNFNVSNIDGNTAATASVIGPTLPGVFITSADGSQRLNTDYFTNVELTGTNPQVVTYTINPKAVWSDGTPIVWEDLAALAHACSGRDERYLIASSSGYEQVKSVTRGVDDRQAVVTFDKPYSEWRALFGGLQPHRMTADPDVFNKGQLNAPGPSAGPFVVSTINRTAQRVVLTRNPRWWGAKPRLDSITFLVLDPLGVIPALQNNAIDSADLGSLADMVTARRTPGIAIRSAPALEWYHITFNGARGSIVEDPRLRLAISKGIDRQAIANVVQHGLTPHPTPLNNHIFMAGQVGYQDNSAPAAYNPDRARQELDALGWKLNGAVREKNGKQLVIRDPFYDQEFRRQIGLVAQQNLAQIGVKLVLDPKPGTGFFSQYVSTGDFDVVEFGWVGGGYPLSALRQIYASKGESNFGKIGSPKIDGKIDQALSELDPDRARALANEIDRMLWWEGFSLPLFQSPGDVAVRSDLANYGAFGLADVDWMTVGFTS
jgi:peptide/nickel transport system substrate-binding protein